MPDYEYFCGANIVVQVEDFPVLEAVGISYQAQESKMPIYGYSSRHFDAVARGQVIVQGSLAINYVQQDYLFHAIRLGLNKKKVQVDGFGSPNQDLLELADIMKENDAVRDEIFQELVRNYPENIRLAQAFKQRHWDLGVNDNLGKAKDVIVPNPFDVYGGIDIKITFGSKPNDFERTGVTGVLLSNCYFTGRGVSISIDEQSIIEEYGFFARNVYSLKRQYNLTTNLTEDGNIQTTIEGDK